MGFNFHDLKEQAMNCFIHNPSTSSKQQKGFLGAPGGFPPSHIQRAILNQPGGLRRVRKEGDQGGHQIQSRINGFREDAQTIGDNTGNEFQGGEEQSR